MTSSSLAALVVTTTSVITSALRRTESKSAIRNARSFATDICLVASGARTGYLLDTFAVRDPVPFFSDVLTILREASSTFKYVVHVHDFSSGQSMFVNMELLRNRFKDGFVKDPEGYNTLDDWISFVALFDPPRLLPDTPPTIFTVLDFIIQIAQARPTPPSITLPENLTQQTLVPLAAFLLEYPVGYVPASPQQTVFLNDVPLDVYECLLVPQHSSPPPQGEITTSPHTLLKFSCPCIMGFESDRLSVSVIKKGLQDRFQSKVEHLGFRLEIRHEIKTLDRVGL